MSSPRRVTPAPDPARPGRGVVVPMVFVGDDEALVEGLRQGNPAAKAALFQRYAGPIERVITHVLGYDRELSDVLQEVFVNALSSIHTLDDPRALRPWLSRVATLTALKLLRSRSRRRLVRLFVDREDEAQWELPAIPGDEGARRALRAVYAALDELPPEQRVLFALRFVEGMEVSEVAQACDVSLSTAKRKLKRAEQRFLALARRYPELSEWMQEGTRWPKT